jgi:hypothetical protein
MSRDDFLMTDFPGIYRPKTGKLGSIRPNLSA